MRSLAFLAFVALATAGCFGSGCLPGVSGDGPAHATLHTDWGDIVIELLADEAPITVDNFARLAQNGTYDGTRFWRMENEFMMQGGDPTNEGDGGWGADGHAIPDELTPDRSHDRRGIVAMANRGPDTGRSQFYITFSPAPSLNLEIDGNIHKGHTIFGEVVDGMDVVAGLNYYAAGPNDGDDRGIPYHNVTLDGVSLQCGLQEAPRVNLLTPTVWDIRSRAEIVAAWSRGVEDPQWSITMPDGSPLPSDWRFNASPLSSVETSDGWTMALLALILPEDVVSGFEHVVLHAGDASQPIQLRIAGEFEPVAGPGDDITITYGMREATPVREVQLQQSTVEVTVGSTSTVAGFGWGLAGLADDERAVIHLPAGIAYGYDLPDSDRLAAFNGVDLDYNIQVRDITFRTG